ncbi:hypothetical protein [Mycobacterium uberis]|uniref:hypothetical protein n=1 Tax=Mycobacterium uberis TaxID=2162698 RepID=UPI001FB4CB5A|nr:hypothetical protein [Mycobacterium uberis]
MFTGPTVGIAASILKIISIEWSTLRWLSTMVGSIAGRLRAGRIVVAFPEGTAWCGLAGPSHRGCGLFYPAMFKCRSSSATTSASISSH